MHSVRYPVPGTQEYKEEKTTKMKMKKKLRNKMWWCNNVWYTHTGYTHTCTHEKGGAIYLSIWGFIFSRVSLFRKYVKTANATTAKKICFLPLARRNKP